MNYDVINAYVSYWLFQEYIFSDIHLLNLHDAPCYDEQGTAATLLSNIGIKTRQIFSQECPAIGHHEEIEKYLYKQYEPEHRAYIVFAILYGLPKKDVETLALKKNKRNAGDLLNNMLCKNSLPITYHIKFEDCEPVKLKDDAFFRQDNVVCFTHEGHTYSVIEDLNEWKR